MDFLTINGDEPRLSEHFILARMANAFYQGEGLGWFVTPVRVDTGGSLQMQVIREDDFTLLSYEMLLDLMWEVSFPNRKSAEMWISGQARSFSATR